MKSLFGTNKVLPELQDLTCDPLYRVIKLHQQLVHLQKVEEVHMAKDVSTLLLDLQLSDWDQVVYIPLVQQSLVIDYKVTTWVIIFLVAKEKKVSKVGVLEDLVSEVDLYKF